MIVVLLTGGFGNRMFQIAFVEYLKDLTGSQVNVYDAGIRSPHASTDLMSGVFQNWKESLVNLNVYTIPNFVEKDLMPYDWKSIIDKTSNLYIIGYFQNYKYIIPSFINKLNFSNEIINKYPAINNTVFLHIRGGDYLTDQKFYLDLDKNYYQNAIKEFPQGTKFSIFTNDMSFAQSKSFLNDISHEFIEESEVDSMYLMSQCKGGICANSSFSWWGAYLNKNRKLVLPSMWYTGVPWYTQGYYFPEATVIDV